MNPSPVIVTGTPRSGTFIVARVLAACGAWLGNVADRRQGDVDAFELPEVTERLLIPFLRGVNADTEGLRRLPDIRRVKGLSAKIETLWRARVIEAMAGGGSGIRALVSYRHCLIWPVWKAAFPDARWIVVRRDPEEIVRACMKTRRMDTYKGPDGWRGWLAGYNERLDAVGGTDVWPSRIMDGDIGEMRGIIESLGLRWSARGVADVVEPLQWRSGNFEGASAWHE